MTKGALWVEKYRPRSLENYILADTFLGKKLKEWFKEGAIPQLLLTGPAGGGKTTLAQIILKKLAADESDVLVINASDENNVDTIRDKVKNFVSTIGMGDFKYIHLDECDYLSANAQPILRRLMEDYSDSARFILSCNYEHKIIQPLKSRCQHFRFKPADKLDIAERCIEILANEGVDFNLELLEKFIATGYPDIRKIIALLQQHSVDGVLCAPTTSEETGDYKFQLIELIEQDDWPAARKLVCSSVGGEEWEDLYRFLYENLDKSPKFKNAQAWDQGIISIADHLYKHSICADPEINCAALLIQLGQI